jgi:hypothetical protein
MPALKRVLRVLAAFIAPPLVAAFALWAAMVFFQTMLDRPGYAKVAANASMLVLYSVWLIVPVTWIVGISTYLVLRWANRLSARYFVACFAVAGMLVWAVVFWRGSRFSGVQVFGWFLVLTVTGVVTGAALSQLVPQRARAEEGRKADAGTGRVAGENG